MNFLDDLLFFIYPKSCGICKKIENNFLCEKCERKLKTSELFVNQIIDYEKIEQNILMNMLLSLSMIQ